MSYKRQAAATADTMGDYAQAELRTPTIMDRVKEAMKPALRRSSTPAAAQVNAEHESVNSLNEHQSAHFYECMTKPKPLSGELQRGIKKMQELSRKK